MDTVIALLRGVNVGGKKLAMADLRRLCADLGFTHVRTLLQSGNVVLSRDARSEAEIQRLLELETERRLGLSTRVFLRSPDEWAELVEGNPFPEAARDDPSHLLVLFLDAAPDPEAMAALRKAIAGRETVAARGRQMYAVYPDGIGHSRLTNAVIERALHAPCTGRNWNTVLKLGTAALLNPPLRPPSA